ncbi:hypothetical protein O181_099261 [Austropuccinia psidii MF-1]|uniref:Uncharacterized protein n=1 Tax=Austropuccinia psidii MF-1 TaxID=1389203 RepID=A0A9Q3JD33_9BASI|nr:hypothetical protein [Austropuccinia psidii MF-1]
MLVMLSNKHTRNAPFLSNPSNHASRGVPDQHAIVRTPFWSTMMKAFPSGNGCREQFRTISPVPSSINLSTPLLGHHPMVTSLLDWSKVIIWPMKDGNGKRTFKLGLIVTMSCHPWDSNTKLKQNQPNPLQQDSPVRSLPCKPTSWKLTPGLSGTQWLEDLFCGKKPKSHLIYTFDSSELTLPAFVEPSRTDEPPIPGPHPSSKPHEDVPTCDPDPEVALTQSMEEPFACPTPPHCVIIIDNTPIGSHLPLVFPLHPLLPQM